MSKSRLICFIGIDGSGKTTLARRLTEEMSKNGIKTKYLMGRFEKFILLKPCYWVVKKMFLSRVKTDQSAEGVRTKRGLFKNRCVARMWQFSLEVDYLIQLGYKVRLPLMLGTSVCADRYIYDTLVDLTADSALSVSKMQSSLNALLRVAPRSDIVFLVDLPEDIAYERNLAKKDNLSLEYLRQRRRLYLNFKERYEVEVVDGLHSPGELFHEILKKLKSRKILV